MPTPLIPGQEIGGTVVLSMIDPDHYRVRRLCCGREVAMARATLVKRNAGKLTQCATCAAIARSATRAQGFSYSAFVVGDVVGGTRIEAITINGFRARDCLYTLTYLCCGNTDQRTHEQIMTRRMRGASSCRFCSREASGITRVRRVEPPPPPPPPPPRRLITLADINRHLARIFK